MFFIFVFYLNCLISYFWAKLFSAKPRIHKAFRYFFNLGRPVGWQNVKKGPLVYDVFARLTHSLYKPIGRKQLRYSNEVKNRVRVRYFFGGISNQKLRTLSRIILKNGRYSNNLLVSGEGLLFCILFRVNFFQTFAELKQLRRFIELGAISVNNKPVFNLFRRIYIGDCIHPSNYEWYCFFFLYFTLLVFQKKLIRRQCDHILSDFKLLSFLYYQKPKAEALSYTLGLDLPSALLYYKKPQKVSSKFSMFYV